MPRALSHVTRTHQVSAINAALETLRRSDVELARMPLLRVERGVWRFNTYVPSDHHSTVLLEGFAAPAAACGWMAYENVQLAQSRYGCTTRR